MTPDPEFARLPAWLGECQDLEPPKPSLRPLFLALALVAVSLWGWSVHAATVTLTCTPPTTHTDNSPVVLPLTYKAYWGTSPTTMTQTAPLAGPGCKGSLSVPDAPAGGTVTYHVAVTATAGAAESAKSNVASKTLSAPPPNPLMLLTTTDGVGYQINLGTSNKISLSRIASVPAGKPCIASMSVTDPYRTVHVIQDRMWAVMDANPKLPGQTFARPRQVWAKCEAS